jgi:hypothetical protein
VKHSRADITEVTNIGCELNANFDDALEQTIKFFAEK